MSSIIYKSHDLDAWLAHKHPAMRSLPWRSAKYMRAALPWMRLQMARRNTPAVVSAAVYHFGFSQAELGLLVVEAALRWFPTTAELALWRSRISSAKASDTLQSWTPLARERLAELHATYRGEERDALKSLLILFFDPGVSEATALANLQTSLTEYVGTRRREVFPDQRHYPLAFKTDVARVIVRSLAAQIENIAENPRR